MPMLRTTVDSAPEGAYKADVNRIALISDTHFMAADGSDVPQPLLDALAGTELIVHLGHISSAAALDRLASVAPVVAVQTELDDKLMGDRFSDETASGRTLGYARILEAGGVRIGLVHDFSARGVEVSLIEDGDGHRFAFPNISMSEILTSKFGTPLDVVAFAATHEPRILHREGVLLVNPGSPNLPGGRRKGGPGTIAILAVRDGTVEVEFVTIDPSAQA